MLVLKLNLVKTFRITREQLALVNISRLKSKEIRKQETDSIKLLVEYATDKGSNNAKFYYSDITRLVNKTLGIESGTRDDLSKDKLTELVELENFVDLYIRRLLREGKEYKEIYIIMKKEILRLFKPIEIDK